MVVRVALDWTANTTHAALLFAESRGFAKEETGVSLEFVEPTSTDAPPTPLDGLIDGKVDVAICPCDHVLKEHMGQDRVICVATLTAVDISAVCVLESSDITGFVSTRSHGTPCILILLFISSSYPLRYPPRAKASQLARLQPADKTQ